ncbi:MAG: hypothetical protein FWF81_04550 [Defluviitaleaceae bacterium]|nr:hypothetical protein [Defluviitaleaceae bacterium]
MCNKNHDSFVDIMKPYPFNQSGSKSVYVKILETQMIDKELRNEQTFYQISIINRNMLDFDYEFFTQVKDPGHIWY